MGDGSRFGRRRGDLNTSLQLAAVDRNRHAATLDKRPLGRLANGLITSTVRPRGVALSTLRGCRTSLPSEIGVGIAAAVTAVNAHSRRLVAGSGSASLGRRLLPVPSTTPVPGPESPRLAQPVSRLRVETMRPRGCKAQSLKNSRPEGKPAVSRQTTVRGRRYHVVFFHGIS